MATKKPKQEQAQPRSWEVIVAEAREVVQAMAENERTVVSGHQWRIGDLVLEAVPVGTRGQTRTSQGQERYACEQVRRLAEEIGLPYSRAQHYRWTANRWPAEKREPRCAFSLHQGLRGRPDRFEWITAAAEEGWTWERLRFEARFVAAVEPNVGRPSPPSALWEAAKAAAKVAEAARLASRKMDGLVSFSQGAVAQYQQAIETLTDEQVAKALAAKAKVENNLGWLEVILRTRKPLDAQLLAQVDEG